MRVYETDYSHIIFFNGGCLINLSIFWECFSSVFPGREWKCWKGHIGNWFVLLIDIDIMIIEKSALDSPIAEEFRRDPDPNRDSMLYNSKLLERIAELRETPDVYKHDKLSCLDSWLRNVPIILMYQWKIMQFTTKYHSTKHRVLQEDITWGAYSVCK